LTGILDTMDIAVIGAGRVGTAMAVLLRRAGHRIVAVAGSAATRERAERHLPGVPVLANEAAAREAAVVLIGTPDTAIEPVCAQLAKVGVLDERTALAHLSGATGLDALAAAEAVGATVLSVHPLQTCPDVETSIGRIPGCVFAVSARAEAGYLLGERLALDAGGLPFRLDDAMKPLYHAAAVFASNYLVVLTALAEGLERTAGVPDPLQALEPIQRATLDNVVSLGPSDALTGPSVRGDALTVDRNLRALSEHAPDAVPGYVALADLALALAARSGRLSEDGRAAVEEVLARWS
jgi:predicted short-subunit dehydrogenase-like oxidoreductase (DUF2520 family)